MLNCVVAPVSSHTHAAGDAGLRPISSAAARRHLAVRLPPARRDQGRPLAAGSTRRTSTCSWSARPTSSNRSRPTGPPYRFTHKEVRNTGLPRFDRLLTLGRRGRTRRTATLVLDRADLADAASPIQPKLGSQRMREVSERFWTSEYYRAWIRAARLTRDRGGSRARQGLAARVHAPPAASSRSLARIAAAGRHRGALVRGAPTSRTDYARYGRARHGLLVGRVQRSPYLDRPVVYYQFDRDGEGSGGPHRPARLLRLRARRVRPGGARP